MKKEITTIATLQRRQVASRALDEIAVKLGRNYKAAIRRAWESGNYYRDGLNDYKTTLQSARNASWGGPRWLSSFKASK